VNIQDYIIPANSKKQGLIFGFLRPLDLGILISGIVVTFILLLLLPVEELWAVIVTLIPVMIVGILVFPVPNYHNVRVLLMEIYAYFFKVRRKYVWRGWCYQYEQSDDEQ